jgi:hypothetical protein
MTQSLITPCIRGSGWVDSTISGSERLSGERHKRRHRAIRKKLYCATPEGVEVTAEFCSSR